jgi:hypothetical protein
MRAHLGREAAAARSATLPPGTTVTPRKHLRGAPAQKFTGQGALRSRATFPIWGQGAKEMQVVGASGLPDPHLGASRQLHLPNRAPASS